MEDGEDCPLPLGVRRICLEMNTVTFCSESDDQAIFASLCFPEILSRQCGHVHSLLLVVFYIQQFLNRGEFWRRSMQVDHDDEGDPHPRYQLLWLVSYQ